MKLKDVIIMSIKSGHIPLEDWNKYIIEIYKNPSYENVISLCQQYPGWLNFYIENPTQAVINYHRLYWS